MDFITNITTVESDSDVTYRLINTQYCSIISRVTAMSPRYLLC